MAREIAQWLKGLLPKQENQNLDAQILHKFTIEEQIKRMPWLSWLARLNITTSCDFERIWLYEWETSANNRWPQHTNMCISAQLFSELIQFENSTHAFLGLQAWAKVYLLHLLSSLSHDFILSHLWWFEWIPLGHFNTMQAHGCQDSLPWRTHIFLELWVQINSFFCKLLQTWCFITERKKITDAPLIMLPQVTNGPMSYPSLHSHPNLLNPPFNLT